MDDEDLQKYDLKMHSSISPPVNPYEIKEVSGDGNEKVLVKVSPKDASLKRAGRPPARKKPKPISNGWFLICHPGSGRILGVYYMLHPENN